ncbi:hypothetical protein ACFZDK_09850 [Streptomyces sp. NPDC007901]|uniref:hypothetical protein n=1 Tax=Streptomyces sp. NPDC007901 TaxID=3364785 RepID=UPI0036E4105F
MCEGSATNTEHLEQGWEETVALFERRGLPESSYENLDEESYDILPGPLTVPGELDLDALETSGTGVVVDGDLTVGGNIVNVDDGCPALIVLGDLRARVTILSGEFSPELVGGTLHGAVVAPAYLDLAQDVDPASVLVPEVLRADGEDCPRGFDAPRVHGGRLLSRIDEGLPVVLG